MYFFFFSLSLPISCATRIHIDRFQPMVMSHNLYWALHQPLMIEASICHAVLSMHRYPNQAPKTVGNWTFIVSTNYVWFIAKPSSCKPFSLNELQHKVLNICIVECLYTCIHLSQLSCTLSAKLFQLFETCESCDAFHWPFDWTVRRNFVRPFLIYFFFFILFATTNDIFYASVVAFCAQF